MKWRRWFVTADIKRAVKRGAAVLDANQPGWRHLVDVGRLNMWSPGLCVLGQVYGDYSEGLVRLGLDPWLGDPEVHGFYPFVGEEWASRRQWKRVIRQGRR